MACHASLFISISLSLLKLMSVESLMPSNHLILCRPSSPALFLSIRVFFNESVLCIRWPKYWSFSFSINPSNIIIRVEFLYVWLVWSPCCPRVFSSTTVQKHQFFGTQASLSDGKVVAKYPNISFSYAFHPGTGSKIKFQIFEAIW